MFVFAFLAVFIEEQERTVLVVGEFVLVVGKSMTVSLI